MDTDARLGHKSLVAGTGPCKGSPQDDSVPFLLDAPVRSALLNSRRFAVENSSTQFGTESGVVLA